MNAKTLKAGALDVIGSFTAQNVEVGSVYVDGALALNSLTVTGEAKIENGTLNLLGVTEKDAKDIAGKVTVTGAGLLTTNKAALMPTLPSSKMKSSLPSSTLIAA